MPQAFNNAIHAFRGFAILNVLAIHAFAWLMYYASTVENPAAALSILGNTNAILFHDATLYFTLISGVLFSMILAERGYARFYQKKFNYVILPYVFFSFLYTLLSVDMSDPSSSMVLFDGSMGTFLKQLATNLVTGTANPALYYIPILMSLYLLTPVLARLVSMKRATWLKALIILAPLVCSRVWPQVSWTNYVYFLGAYLIGLIVGAHYQETLRLIERFKPGLIAVAIASSMAIYYKGHFEVPNFGITNLAESFWYIQKTALAALVLLWFEKSLTHVPKWLELFGNYAFALYFVHGFVMVELTALIGRAGIPLHTTSQLLLCMLGVLLLMTAISVLIIFAGKKVLGKRSRYFLGA